MLPENHNDFRSDTFTTPTKSLLESVALASVGDSVYDEDKDTIDLEHKIASMMGFQAGLFCVSGTLSNQIALRTHLQQPPHSILCDYRGHVYVHEAGGLATLSQAMVSPVIPSNGLYLTLEDIIDHFIPDDGDIHAAPTRVVSLENTLHGLVYPIEELKKISSWCRENNIKLHLDGARIWDASIASGLNFKDYGELFDSISVCLSKGIGAPVGSVLVGEETFIRKANHFKKQNGGGIRQSGLLARMASIAVDENFPEMYKAHELAKEVADYAESLGFKLEIPCQTNFVFLHPKDNHVNFGAISEFGKKYNIKCMSHRFTFSFQTSREAVDNLKLMLKDLKEYSILNPYNPKTPSKLYTQSKH